jgi:hypothetical protein
MFGFGKTPLALLMAMPVVTFTRTSGNQAPRVSQPRPAG